MNCEQVRELAPELALGIASGEERAAALAHLGSCSDCRNALEDMNEVADELLLLTPTIEPPAGFETKVLGERPARPRRWARPLAAAAAVLAIAGAAAGLTWAAGGHDRSLAADAARQHQELKAVNGNYFTASEVRGNDGKNVGQAFGYDGSPSWVYIVGDPPMVGHSYRVWAITSNGRRIDLGNMKITGDDRGWGALLPVSLNHVRDLRIVGDSGYICTAQLHTD